MTFPLKIVGLLKTKITGDFIQITTDQTSLQTVGINLTFATGTLTVDWGDGSSTENFVSGIELTHSYGSTAIYNIKIYGDLANITAFISDNNRITNITGLKTGLLTDFQIQNNLYSGTLDLSNAPVSSIFYAYNNAGLTSITFAGSGNSKLTDTRIFNCNISSLDFSNVPIGSSFWVYSNPLTTLTFATSGNSQLINFRADACNLTSLDLSNVPVASLFRVESNSNLTSITFASSGNGTLTVFYFYNCNITGSIDLATPDIKVSNDIYGYNNTSFTGFSFATTGNGTLDNIRLFNCNISSLDFSNVPIGNSAIVWLYTNPLTTLTFKATGNGTLLQTYLNSCQLPNLDFSVFSTSIPNIRLYDNAMSSTEVDDQLINLDGTGWINGILNIAGTNAARTSASDTAYSNLISNGWTITVN